MTLFALSIFLSAFLLFQIQPMIGKVLLPWFGGTPAVWSTVMLFFQVLLTGGYAYAYWLIGRVQAKRQSSVHIGLLIASLALMAIFGLLWPSPVTPPPTWKPADVSSPILDIFKLLIVSVGLPYFILASNGPLMQAWFSRIFPDQSYARLYALSNSGSLLGLLAYPFLIEPNLSLRWQGLIWAGGFVLFGLLAGRVALSNRRTSLPAQAKIDPVILSPKEKSSGRPSPALRALWIVLSMTASMFLLAVTNQVSQEVAVIPFLWILPLTLYLFSFILTFSGERWYPRRMYVALFAASAAVTLWVMLNAISLHVYWQILAYCLLLFTACMLCNGELHLLRPQATHLTSFYLMISVGGASGGIFVSLIAPLVFNGYWEFMVALAMTIALILTVSRAGRAENLPARARFMFTVFLLVTVMLIVTGNFSGAQYSKRNFYGVVRVREIHVGDPAQKAYVMSHGITIHGFQYLASEKRDQTTSYYVKGSGIELALHNHPRYGHGMRVGVLGLGAGVLAAYGGTGDVYRLYEINPVVMNLAKGQGNYFSFLRDSKADVTVVPGDARISLERELVKGQPQNYDLLVLDVFSSDAVPAHLLTKEAFDIYLKHLALDGILAANITNLHLDLQPVFWQLAKYYHLDIVRINREADNQGGYESHWILLARDPALLELPAIREHAVDLDGYTTSLRLWTDDYSNLFQILK